MKWTYAIRQKQKTAFVLGIISLLIILINAVDKRHFSHIRHSFDSVYEDRLLVESYIYELSGYFHRKKTMVDQGFSETNRQKNNQYNDSIANLLTRYGNTVLTPSESGYFGELQLTYTALCTIESPAFGAGGRINQTAVNGMYEKLDVLLHKLSDIQLAESRRMIDESKGKIAFSGMTSQLEIAIIIFIGLIGQVLIFNSKTVDTKFTRNSMWN